MFQRYYENKAGFYEDLSVATQHKPEKAETQCNPNQISQNGPKICCLISPDPSNDELKYIRQLGVSHVFTWITNEQTNLKFLQKLKNKTEKYNLTLYNVANRTLCKNRDIILGTPKVITKYTHTHTHTQKENDCDFA